MSSGLEKVMGSLDDSEFFSAVNLHIHDFLESGMEKNIETSASIFICKIP